MNVFISHSFEDDATFQDICFILDKFEIDYWKPDEIMAGQPLRQKLQDAIESCAVCVLIATAKSLSSAWCQMEVGAFWGSGKTVVVYLTDEDLRKSKLYEPFLGDKWASSIRDVVESVKEHVKQAVREGRDDTRRLADMTASEFAAELLSRIGGDATPERLKSTIGLLDAAESVAREAEKKDLRVVRRTLETRLAALSEKGESYEAIRRDMPSGPERTFEMTKIIAQAKAIAGQEDFEPIEVSNMFAENTEGSRITALAMLQVKPDLVYFWLVLEAVRESRSAFEQYEALRALEGMVPDLDRPQRRQVIDLLHSQRGDEPGSFITRGSDRWNVSERILQLLDRQ